MLLHLATQPALAMVWRPTAPLPWAGKRFGPLFDPLAEFGGFSPPASRPQPRPVMLYLPGLDGNAFTAFAQFPTLGASFDLRVLFADRSDAASGGDHDGLVAAVADEVQSLASSGREVWLMGESFGGVQALAVALRTRESRPLRGLVLVNPATSYPRTDLPPLADEMLEAPAWRFYLMSASLFAGRVGDETQLRTILSTLWDNPLDDPERCPPPLAAYLKALLPAFVEGFQAPREYFLARLGSLGAAADAVNAQLEAWRDSGDDGGGGSDDGGSGGALGGVPCIVVAGTVDRLALSATEAPRLQALLGGEAACAVHFVEGAGHSGTLDDRIDLAGVLEAWAGQPSFRRVDRSDAAAAVGSGGV